MLFCKRCYLCAYEYVYCTYLQAPRVLCEQITAILLVRLLTPVYTLLGKVFEIIVEPFIKAALSTV